MKIPLLISLLCMQQLDAFNKLEKVYLHKAPVSEELTADPQLEMAKLVFYFHDEPNIQLISSLKGDDGFKHESYLVTSAEIDAACRSKLQAIAKENNAYYRIVCSELKEPERGMKIDLYYEPTKVSCCLDEFDSITNHKGVVFRLVNKTLLDQLALQEKSFIKLASLGKPTVVIDSGHGGPDPGAIGFNGAFEKNVTLQVGLYLAELLKRQGYRIYLTRAQDNAVALDSRTAFINLKKPDLYVSIHANSSSKNVAQGLETFCLEDRLFKHIRGTDQFQEYMQMLYERSNRLGSVIQQHLLAYMGQEGYQLCDGKVHHAVSQLLLGTNVPGVLIEIGYLSNPDEASYLVDASYQQKIAQGICEGITAFFRI